MTDPVRPPPAPPLDYASPARRHRRWPWFVAGTVLLLLIGIELLRPTLHRPRGHAPWQHCSSNLRQIHLGLLMYANDHRGAFPPGWTELADHDLLTADVFVCRSHDPMITRAAGPTTRAIAEAIGDPAKRHCSYVYAAAGLTDTTVQPDDVLAFEWPADATDGSAMVLLGDGRAERLNAGPNGPNAREYVNLQDDYAKGVRPLRRRP